MEQGADGRPKKGQHVKKRARNSETNKGQASSNLYQQANPNYTRFIWYWLPLLIFATSIALLSSLSTPKVHLDALTTTFFSGPITIHPRINDKVFHLAIYSVLGLLTYRAFRFSWGSKLGPFTAFLSVGAVAFYGCTDEFHQWFVPFRQVEALDLIADTFGGLIGVSLWEWALTIPVIRFLEEQLPRTLPLLRSMTTSKF